MKSHLSRQLKEYYNAHALNTGQLEHLMKLQRSNIKEKKPLILNLLPLIFSGFLVGGFVFIVLQLSSTVPEKVMTEVSLGHRLSMDADYKATSYKEVQSHLNRLQFSLVVPEFLNKNEWIVLGGSYGRLLGQVVGLIHLKNRGNHQHYTLYQQPYSDKWGNEVISQKYYQKDGIKIKAWREKGMLLILAGP